MAKLLSRSIDDFIETDTDVSDDGAFVNVRDLQVFRQNHNAILANGARRNTAIITFKRLGSTFAQKTVESIDSLSIVDNVPISRSRIAVSSNTKQLHCWVRGELVSAEYEEPCSLAVHVFNPRNPRDIDRQHLMTWTSNGVIADKTCTVDLPAFSRDKIGMFTEYEVGLYMLPTVTTSNIIVGSTTAITSSNNTSIQASSTAMANITEGDIIETTSTERAVVRARSGTTLSIYNRWQDAPVGSLTYAVHVPRLKLHYATIMEAAVSDFSAEIDRL